ncbi:MAG TPA: serine hydrolase, partial [Chitinophagaceae bacterium]|nr:serine hydrolase [Chitinophagaceae bacterium]
MKKWIFAIAFVMPFQLLAQYNFSALDARIDAMKKELGGFASVVVAKDGKVIYKKNLGEDFNERTQVQIASSSKWLTAAMVLALVDAGKLSLDDKVSQYIPDFTKYNK